MATTVTLTGTGGPPITPGRAGAGVFVKYNDVVVQFDAHPVPCAGPNANKLTRVTL